MRIFVVACCMLGLFAGHGWGQERAKSSDWPHWRGPSRDGHSPESSGWAAGKWIGDQPSWQVQVGTGSSSPIVVGDKLYTLGNREAKDHLECRNAETGQLLWSVSYPCKQYGRFHEGDEGLYSGPSSTPEYDPSTQLLYTLSVNGQLHCWDTRAEGKKVWAKSIYDDFQVGQRPKLTRAPRRDYGYTTSPLVHQDWLLVEAGSTKFGSVMAFNKRSGQQLWASELQDEAGHCGGMSPITIEGIPAIAVLTQRRLAVIRLDGDNAGKTLASFPWVTDFANTIASPAVHGDSVLITSAYNQNAMVRLRISTKGVEEVWRQKTPSKVCTPVIHKGHVYVAWQRMRCLDWETGKLKWEGGTFGDPGSIVLTADERLLVYGLNGKLALVNSATQSPEKYQELSVRDKLFRTHGWPHVVLAHQRIYCRDRQGNLACFRIP